MTQAEFIDIVKNMPEGMTLTSAPECTSPELFFEFLCDWKLQDWVDAEAAECYFDTPQFMEILELTMTAPLAEPIDFEELDRNTSEEESKVLMNERMHSTILGKSLFSIGHGITSYHDFPFLNDVDSEKTIFINAPSEHPAGQLRAYEYFSVINGGNCTEGGWDLMNYAVSDEFLTSDLNTLYSFVTRKDTFERITQMHRRWSENPPSEGERREGFCLTYDKPITDGEMAEYRNMIDKSTILYGTSTAVKSILTEEYAQFAAGEITASVCAERMQDRVTIYLSENL